MSGHSTVTEDEPYSATMGNCLIDIVLNLTLCSGCDLQYIRM